MRNISCCITMRDHDWGGVSCHYILWMSCYPLIQYQDSSTEEAWDQSHSPLQWRPPPPCLSHHKRSYDVSRNTHLPAATNILYILLLMIIMSHYVLLHHHIERSKNKSPAIAALSWTYVLLFDIQWENDPFHDGYINYRLEGINMVILRCTEEVWSSQGTNW